MKCILCGSEEIQTVDTVVSDFVMARIDPGFQQHGRNIPTKLCFCKSCTFAFYAYRFSPEEEAALYMNYRDEAYQKLREKYECWYTKKVNAEINKGEPERQQKCIKKLLDTQGGPEIRIALDYGGNQGATFFDSLGTEAKYVYDISEAKTLPGITGIREYSELCQHHYDFVMCNMVFEHLADPYGVLKKLYDIGDDDTLYYLEVPGENPFVHGNKFSAFRNLHLLFNGSYNWFRLVKYYFQVKKQPFMPMKEHINFFTEKSLTLMAEKGGFQVIDVELEDEHGTEIISVLMKKRFSGLYNG